MAEIILVITSLADIIDVTPSLDTSLPLRLWAPQCVIQAFNRFVMVLMYKVLVKKFNRNVKIKLTPRKYQMKC